LQPKLSGIVPAAASVRREAGLELYEHDLLINSDHRARETCCLENKAGQTSSCGVSVTDLKSFAYSNSSDTAFSQVA
jgi:hypothetical protein